MILAPNKAAVYDYLLKDPILNANIIGVIENRSDAQIYIDNAQHISAVLVRLGYFNYVHTESRIALDSLLDTMFRQEGYYGFSGVQRSLAEQILKRFKMDWRNPCDLYYLPEGRLDMSQVKNPVVSVSLKDADIIDSFYTFRNENSLSKIVADIEKRPSAAVYIDGTLASWVLTHEDNSMGIMYTREEYRKKGYGVDVTLTLAKKLSDMGKIPYLQILESNTASPGLAVKCGFVLYDKCDWFGIAV